MVCEFDLWLGEAEEKTRRKSEGQPGHLEDVCFRAAYGGGFQGADTALRRTRDQVRGSLCECLVFQVVDIAVKSTVVNEHEDSAGLHKAVEDGVMSQQA